jgi:hypothetical protein
MIRLAIAAFAFACLACAPPGDGAVSGQVAPDAGLPSVDAGCQSPDDRRRGPGAVCARNDDCLSGNCEKLFVCEQDRAVSCSRDGNDCVANGLPDSACVEEGAGTCSPTARPGAHGRDDP